jgi:hypothetical protein
MPRINVHLENGNWRVWSTVCDGWITDELDFNNLKIFRRDEYKTNTEVDKETDSLLTKHPIINVMNEKQFMEDYGWHLEEEA